MDNGNRRKCGAAPRMVSCPRIAMTLALATVSLLLALSLSVQESYAADFVADAQCVEGHWYVSIHDMSIQRDNAGTARGEENPRKDGGLLPGVSIRTIESAGSSNVKSIFETDENGSFFLAPEYNTGWVWLSKPGYNDQKVRSSCDTAYDAFSYSEQFASYCYDYAYQFVPMTYLPVMSAVQSDVGSVRSIMDFFDGQITLRDETIKKQTLEIKRLADSLNNNNNTSVTPALSNSTNDALCLLYIEDATSKAYEALGALYALRSGILAEHDAVDTRALGYDDVNSAQVAFDAGVVEYCSDITIPETAQEVGAGLETIQVLYEEMRRQAVNLQYELLALSLGGASSHHQPHTQQNQSYYYYDNNYYLDDSHYDGSSTSTRNNDERDFYYYDATGSKPYDYANHDHTQNYNPEDHEDHDHTHGYCVTFCDQYDYEPDWARYLDKHKAREACWDVEADPDRIGTDDWYWCKDLGKYLFYN